MTHEQMAHLAAMEREGIEAESEWTEAEELRYAREEEIRRLQWEINQY